MSFLIPASDRSSGGVSGPSFSGISSFCGVSSVLLAMSLTAGTEPRASRVPDSLKGRLPLPKTSSVEESFDSLNKCAGKITKFHQPPGFEKAQARAHDHSVKRTCARLQYRKPASLEADILVFRHQLNVLNRKLRPCAGLQPGGKVFCDIFNSLN